MVQTLLERTNNIALKTVVTCVDTQPSTRLKKTVAPSVTPPDSRPNQSRHGNGASVRVRRSRSVEWSTQDLVVPVKNQGQCGSGWSSSTTGASHRFGRSSFRNFWKSVTSSSVSLISTVETLNSTLSTEPCSRQDPLLLETTRSATTLWLLICSFYVNRTRREYSRH